MTDLLRSALDALDEFDREAERNPARELEEAERAVRLYRFMKSRLLPPPPTVH